MKLLIIPSITIALLKGILGEKVKGACVYPLAVIANSMPTFKSPVWRIYGYIESEAPFRNPFYLPCEGAIECAKLHLIIEKNETAFADFHFTCGDDDNLNPSRGCLNLILDSKEQYPVKFKYWPDSGNNSCKEWTTINNIQTDYKDYLILFGCEADEENFKYVGLWIFIPTDQNITREEEKTTTEKIKGIIQDFHGGISDKIKYVGNRTMSSKCNAKSESPYSVWNREDRCRYERLDTCWMEQNLTETKIRSTSRSSMKYVMIILFIFVILVFLVPVGFNYCCHIDSN